MYRILIFIYLLILNFLISCENNSEPIDDSENKFFPLKIGNYWIYNSYEKDFNNNIISSTQTEDSVVIEFSENILGEIAFYFVKYRNGKVNDTLIFAYSGQNIYRLFDSNSIPIPNMIRTWFPVINFQTAKNITYNVYKKLINNYLYFEDNIVYTANYWHTINGEYTYNDSIDFENSKLATKKFSNKYDSKLEYKKVRKLTETSYDTLLVNRLMKYYDKYQLVEGIGLFKLQRDSYTINTMTEPSSTFEKVEYVKGFESLLKRYKLK
ncbi:MAG: hypothetical protein V1779_17340 [bacterium]